MSKVCRAPHPDGWSCTLLNGPHEFHEARGTRPYPYKVWANTSDTGPLMELVRDYQTLNALYQSAVADYDRALPMFVADAEARMDEARERKVKAERKILRHALKLEF